MHNSRLRKRVPFGPLLSNISQICSIELPIEHVVPVRTAKVMLADYGALLHDFSGIFSSADFRKRYDDHWCAACRQRDAVCPVAVDQWLLDNAAYVSKQQVEAQCAVNTPIDAGAPVARAYRPPRYGRALVLPVDGPVPIQGAALLDIKGAGVAPGVTPSHAGHADGLEYLGVALADFFYSWLVDRILARTEPGYGAAPVYAVLDLGFDITNGYYGTAPAGLHVRRAHARADDGITDPMPGSQVELVQLQIEMLLRAHGLTSAGKGTAFDIKIDDNGDPIVKYAGRPFELGNELERRWAQQVQSLADGGFECMNIQTTANASWTPRFAQIVDFGHFQARKRFQVPLASSARSGVFRVGRIIAKNDPAFVQPVPGIAVDADLCSRACVTAHGFHLAQTFRHERIGRRGVESNLRKAMVRAFRRSVR